MTVCLICQNAETEQGFTCGPDRYMLSRLLVEIPKRFIELGDREPLVDSEWSVTQYRVITDAKGKPVRDRRGDRIVVAYESAGSDIAQTMPMANTTRSIRPPVTGSAEPPLPINEDLVDLTSPVRPGSLGVRYRGRRVDHPDPDQIGHLPVATELDWFVKEWIADRDRGEGLPIPTVPSLAHWLAERLEWACDHSLTIDEFATTLKRIAGALRHAQGDVPQRPIRMDRPCPACDFMTLTRRVDEDYIDCGNPECRRVYTPDEYAEQLRGIARDARQKMAA